MAGIQLSGLVSGSFDWQSVVDQLIKIDGAPIARLQREEADNNNRLASLADLKGGLADLQASAEVLKGDGLFQARKAVSTTSGSTWTATASAATATGTYAIAVAQPATSARRLGAAGIAAALSATDDVTGLTLASLPTATAPTAGTFTVNGRQVTVALTDSLDDVLAKISAATDDNVTATYDHTTDKITLVSGDASEIVLGAANDSSNLLSALRLVNNGTATVASASTLGSVALSSPLASSRLRGAITAVDGSGNGTFTINGVSLGYNINTDSLSTVLARINASAAGVTATYDRTADRVIFANQTTGDVGLGASEAANGLLDALGLTGSSTLSRGSNARFTVNGGATLTSASNTLDATVLGVEGLSVQIDAAGTQSISVTADTAGMKSALQDFLDKFNAVQAFVDQETKITVGANGKVTTSTLSDNREIQAWSRQLRSLAFGSIPGLTGTIKRLEHLGIDFNSTDSQLKIKDTAKLDAALTSHGEDVAAFFNTGTTGFVAKFDTFLTQALALHGGMATQVDTINRQNTDIDAQIEVLKARLENQRTLLTNSFIAMQNAQSTAQQQQKSIEDMFFSKKS